MTSARDLTARLASLLRDERNALADFLVLLADFDRRRLWLELGHPGLFSFLHRDLGLSKSAAHYRKTAAELVQRFPSVVEPLRDGRLCLTTVFELSKVATPENLDEVLPRFFHLSKREAAEVAAEIRPDEAPPRRDVVTVVRTPARVAAHSSTEAAPVLLAELPHANSAPPPAAMMSQANAPLAPPARAAPPALPAPPRAPAAETRAVTEPLTADLRRLHVTVSKKFLEKLEKARASLSHSLPGASAEAILEAGLDLLLLKDAKKRALVPKPRARPPKAAATEVGQAAGRAAGTRRAIPAHVRREVWKRDAGRCQWPLHSGGICGSTLRCELDHVVPEACGGPATVDNLRVLCRVHNEYAACEWFGVDWMDRFARSAPHRPPAGSSSLLSP